MHRSLLDILIDPILKTPLQLEVEQHGMGDSILTGKLCNSDGSSYRISNGIPRFVRTKDDDQEQTADSFGFKWKQQYSYDSPQVRASTQCWQVRKYGFGSVDHMRNFFATRKRILDAGCGSGLSSSLWLDPSDAGVEWIGVDISTAIDVAQERLGSLENTHFIQADVLQLPFGDGTFDTIFSEGVLHHTPSTELALKSLVPLLEPGGEILFYVYRKKGPIREFSDDYIRGIVSSLPPEEAWELLRPLTRLGQALAELGVEVKVPEDIPYLGIKAGHYDVQRLIYWHFAKLYWNEAYSFEENHHINFDWYHPRYAHRQSVDEIRRWCDEAGLDITHLDTEELSGFTVRAIRR